MRKSVSGWIPDWFPKVEKEESRKWEPVDGIQEKITDGQTIITSLWWSGRDLLSPFFPRVWQIIILFLPPPDPSTGKKGL